MSIANLLQDDKSSWKSLYINKVQFNDGSSMASTGVTTPAVANNTVLTTFDLNTTTTAFNLQTVNGSSNYAHNYTLALFPSPLGSTGTGVINRGGPAGPLMFANADRDHCPFYYENDLYIFASYQAFAASPANATDGAKFIIYKLNKQTNTLQIHRLITTGIIVISNAGHSAVAPARYLWRPKPFLYNGRVNVVFTAFYDMTDVTIPMQTIIGEMTDDLTDMPCFTVLNDTIYASGVLANGSNILSARYIDQEPIIDNSGAFLGFILKDEIFERANRNNGGTGSWNRTVLAGPDGKFIKQINGFNSLFEPDNPTVQLDVEGVSLKQNTDGTWTAYLQSIITLKVYKCQLTSAFEYVPNTVARVITPQPGMGCSCYVPPTTSLLA